MVIEAVNQLVNNSNNMVKYIEKTVLTDYESFTLASLQYQKDAGYISEKINGFSEKTNVLKSEIDQMSKSMGTISAVMEHSTQGVTAVAASAASLADEMNSVNQGMNINKEITNTLKGETDKFIY